MLAAAVESALAQTFDDYEVIVVLHGATPEAAASAEAFAGNPKVHVVTTGYSTVAAARNTGIARARGEWIAFLDDDDIFETGKLSAQIAAARCSGADVITCHFSLFDAFGPLAHPGLIPLPSGLTYAEALMLGNFVSGGSAAMVRASTIRSLGGFDETLLNCEDWDMWRRLSWSHAVFMAEERLVRYRRHAANKGLNLHRRLIGESQHFAKMLRDTPPQLQHMLDRAKLAYFETIQSILRAQSVVDDAVSPFRRAVRLPIQLVDRMKFGLRRARDGALTPSA
jgi:glycosyltransferase involved in cell wall biosynthesis